MVIVSPEKMLRVEDIFGKLKKWRKPTKQIMAEVNRELDSRYKISLQAAQKLQSWAIEISGAKRYLKTLPKISRTKKGKDGLYVNYEINKDELDGGLDWPTPVIAIIYAIVNGKLEFLGEIMAYNWETYWLSTSKYEEVDTAENWWDLINEDYQKLLNKKLKK